MSRQGSKTEPCSEDIKVLSNPLSDFLERPYGN